MPRALRCHATHAAPSVTEGSTPAAAVKYYLLRDRVKGADWLRVKAPKDAECAYDVVRLACEPYSSDTASVFLVRTAGLRPTAEEVREAAKKPCLRLAALLADVAPPGSWLLVRQPDADKLNITLRADPPLDPGLALQPRLTAQGLEDLLSRRSAVGLAASQGGPLLEDGLDSLEDNSTFWIVPAAVGNLDEHNANDALEAAATERAMAELRRLGHGADVTRVCETLHVGSPKRPVGGVVLGHGIAAIIAASSVLNEVTAAELQINIHFI